MAKRFTDTDKWKKPFIRGLEGAYKLLWFYIIDDCDHAGIWQVDIEVAELRIGEKLDIYKALEQFSDKIIPFSNGEKWFIPAFIDFQYGELNPENRAHGSVLNQLKKYNLLKDNKPLTSPLQGDKDMDKDKEMKMDKDLKGGMGENFENESQKKELVYALMIEFNFSEIRSPDKLRLLWQFVNHLESGKGIDYFIQTFQSYKKWKEISGEKSHNFMGLIGTPAMNFENGGWDADNWQYKIDNYKPQGKTNPVSRLEQAQRLYESTRKG